MAIMHIKTHFLKLIDHVIALKNFECLLTTYSITCSGLQGSQGSVQKAIYIGLAPLASSKIK
jgi:hypothetical protein